MKNVLKIFLAGYLLLSIIYSTKRYHYFPIDGDLPAIVLSHKGYNTVMHDPFGTNALLHDSVYPAPNRYFAHKALATWFLNVPPCLAPITGPVNAVYYTSALAKTFFHFFILWILAVAVSGRLNPWNTSTLLAAALMLPLFQTFGYNRFMGIIDFSVTYTFFYAGAFSFVLLFFLPAFLEWFHGRKSGHPWLLCILAVVLIFNGPLNAGVIALLVPLLLLARYRSRLKATMHLPAPDRYTTALRSMPARMLIPFVFAFLLALYSLYIGKFNSENLWEQLPLGERYERLPEGLLALMTTKLGWPLLLLMSGINTILLFRFRQEEKAARILTVLRWIGLFAVLYLATLPLGGYREYRPLIIRMDTFLPLTLAMIFYFGLSAHFLLAKLASVRKGIYITTLIVFLAIFFNADLETKKYNSCEREALEAMAVAEGTVVKLEQDCTVLSWKKHMDTTETGVKADLIHRWGITPERKIYYQD